MLTGITGMNSTVAIVDDGLDMQSEDLKDNYVSAIFKHREEKFLIRKLVCRRILGL